jgi:hypothetical protein
MNASRSEKHFLLLALAFCARELEILFLRERALRIDAARSNSKNKAIVSKYVEGLLGFQTWSNYETFENSRQLCRLCKLTEQRAT